MNKAEIEFQASNLRRKFGFSETEAISIKSLLLKEKIITLFAPLDDDFSGMALKVDDKRFLLVNSSHSLGRQHFTIAHELFHLYIDKEFGSKKCKGSDNNSKSERDADHFASHFLIPQNGVLALIPEEERTKNKIKLSNIIKVEQYFSCSRAAMLRKLEAMNLIDKALKESFYSNIPESAMRLGYSTSLYKPGNHNVLIGDYGVLANDLFENDKISESHFASLMSDIDIDIYKE